MRYLMTFSYDGTNFHGYQKQPNLRTIEGELEGALKFINGGVDVTIHSSGRTDRGVHAINQCAHFDLDKEISLYKLKSALNTYTGNDIYVKDIKVVDDNFHARYMVKRKTYIYKLNMNEYNPLERNYVFQYGKKLDINLMNNEIKELIGKHDFSAFVNMEDKKENYIREIFDAYINEENGLLVFTFIGDGFLKYQIRNMVGALIETCTKKRSIKKILLSKDRTTFGKIAPPQGLYLIDIEY